MASWRTVSEADLAATLAQREIDVYRQSSALDGSDPVERLLGSTVDYVRGCIASGGPTRMGPARTIPRGLVIPAMDFAMGKVLVRINVPLNEDRREALRKAEELFAGIAEGKARVEPYTDDGSVDEDARPATTPLADDGPRQTLGGPLW